ncbi:MAG: secretin and TonB N-terminal domain-containing protein [Bacteroidota bacterium]
MKQYFFILMLSIVTLPALAQNTTPILDRKVTIKITNQPLGKVLNIISETAGFNFSYSNSVVKVNKLVSIMAENKTVREILDQLFNGDIGYQQIGNHLVLQKKVVPKNTSNIQNSNSKPSKYTYIVSGYIRDLYSGEGLRNVSIYEKQTLSSALSGDFGYYQVTITSKTPEIQLRYTTQGYIDTLLVLKHTGNGVSDININLKSNLPPPEPELEVINETDTVPNISIDSAVTQPVRVDTTASQLAWQSPFKKVKVEETTVGKWLVGKYQKLSERNIRDSFERQWQVTLLPPIGTNGTLSGLVTNRFSMNLIAGYNGGVNGAEFGGFANLVKGNMKGAQFAGFGNLVGGNVNGAQFAGFGNLTVGNVEGAQFAGFFNHTMGDVYGLQAAGFYNYNHHNADGLQLAGFMNFNRGEMSGAQLAGFGNFTRGQSSVVQIAGFMNVADEVLGGQIAGFINIAKKVRGFQIGFINIADSSDGATLGIINFIKNGLHQMEVSYNDIGQYGLAYRSGTRKLYSTVMVTTRLPIRDTTTLMTYGYGLGTRFKFTEKLYLTLEATCQHLTFNMRSNHLRLQNKLAANIEVKLFKGFALFGGASLNHVLADTRDYRYQSQIATLGGSRIWDYNGTYAQHAWLGYQFGVRLF